MSEWTSSKKMVEQYTFSNGWDWAVITLDERGIFQAVSSFGVYAYDGWTHHGRESLKHFLVGLTEADYFLGKVCGSDGGRSGPGCGGYVFSSDKTLADIKERVLRRRREGYLTHRWARQCWDELRELEGALDDGRQFVDAVVGDCRCLYELVFGSDPCEVAEACRTELAAQPLRFFNEVFRGQLVPALRVELGLQVA